MSNDPSKKIIIDEDWKGQVEAERDALRKGDGGQTPTTDGGQPGAGAAPLETPPAAKPAPAEPNSAREPQLPPPDLVYLAGTLYMQALVALGLIPNPLTKKPTVSLPQARHAIDSLEMLRAKTEGNRSSEETEAIDQMLHELRMTFIEAQKKPATSALFHFAIVFCHLRAAERSTVAAG